MGYRLVSVGGMEVVSPVSIREGEEVVGYRLLGVAGDAGKMGAGEGELSREPEWSEGGPAL